MKVGDKVTLEIATKFAVIPVEFTIIHVMKNHHYTLIAQDRIVVGQQLASCYSNGGFIRQWKLSNSINLLDYKVDDNEVCKQCT